MALDDFPAESINPGVDRSHAAADVVDDHRRFDLGSAQWIRDLGDAAPGREEALRRLYELLLRMAHGELRRRSGQHPITGSELDDLAHQAAADALMAITGKLDGFRGESRFTTWAYRFVILEVSSKLGRHFWQRPAMALEAEDWDRLPDRFGMGPADHVHWHGLVDALRRAVEDELTERQRHVFVAIVLQGVPLDALVVKLASNRNAIYKTMFDARRKLRAALDANGYLTHAGVPAAAGSVDGDARRAIMNGSSALDQFLATDPRDVGCDQALQILHVYAELVDEQPSGLAADRYPGVAAHLAACGPCGEDFNGLLAAMGDRR